MTVLEITGAILALAGLVGVPAACAVAVARLAAPRPVPRPVTVRARRPRR